MQDPEGRTRTPLGENKVQRGDGWAARLLVPGTVAEYQTRKSKQIGYRTRRR